MVEAHRPGSPPHSHAPSPGLRRKRQPSHTSRYCSLPHPSTSSWWRRTPRTHGWTPACELLALALALQDWRHWLEGEPEPFIMWTDHNNLVYLCGTKHLNSQQTRWALFLGRSSIRQAGCIVAPVFGGSSWILAWYNPVTSGSFLRVPVLKSCGPICLDWRRITGGFLVQHVFHLHGKPHSIVLDSAPEFIPQVRNAFCTALRTFLNLSSGYYLQANGQTERMNQMLENALGCVDAQQLTALSLCTGWSTP